MIFPLFRNWPFLLSLALAWPCYATASGPAGAKICLEMLLAAGTAQAEGEPLSAEDIEFEEAFKRAYSGKGYSPGQCHKNVYHFLKSLRSIDADTQVLSLFAVEPETAPLYLFNVRPEESPAGHLWVYRHFVVLRKRRVYDFAHNEPKSLSATDFFAKTLLLDPSGIAPDPHREYDWANSLQVTTVRPADHLSYSNPSLSWQSPSLSSRGWMRPGEIFLSRVEGWELFSNEKKGRFSDGYFLRPLKGRATREALERQIALPAEEKLRMRAAEESRGEQIGYEWLQSLVEQIPGVEVIRRYEMLENYAAGNSNTWLMRNLPDLKTLDSANGQPPRFFDFWGLSTRPVAFADEGDIVVYLNSRGGHMHVGRVAQAKAGLPILVDSKWGILPAVLRHPVDQVPAGYGDRYAVFRLEK